MLKHTMHTAMNPPTAMGRYVKPVAPVLNPCPCSKTMGYDSKSKYKHP